MRATRAPTASQIQVGKYSYYAIEKPLSLICSLITESTATAVEYQIWPAFWEGRTR